MNSAGVAVSDSPTPANLFDEFEEAFQNCLAPLTKEDPLNGINQEELRVNAETNGQRFLELAHRMDAAFLQKRFLLSVQKPELLLMEENHEMRIEISRKDDLIKKQSEVVAEWQAALATLINRVGGGGTAHAPVRTPSVSGTPQPGSMGPSHMPTMMSSASGGPMNVVTPSGSVTIVGAPSPMTHTMSSPMGISSLPHQSSLMPQVPSGGGVGYSPMGGGGSMAPMHGVATSSMGQMVGGVGGAQGPSPAMNMGGGGAPQGQTVPQGGVGGMFHGSSASAPTMSQQGGLQGPLAYLEKTTTNIGLPESRR